jgi:hypothetical protein
MATVPTLFANDYWVHWLAGQSVAWIPANHTRLLHLNVLLGLLRTEVGALCLQQMAEAEWDSRLHADLRALAQSQLYYSEEHATLQLQEQDGHYRLTVGPLSLQC